MNDPFTILDDLTITLPDGTQLYVMEPDRAPGTRGGCGDGPMQIKLKTALMVETMLTFCKLSVLDLSSLFPHRYTEEAIRQRKCQDKKGNIDDALEFIGPSVGPFSIGTCLDEGRKRAPAWFKKDAASLKTYMQTLQLSFSRSNDPDRSDVDIAHDEMGKIKALVHAVNRAHELREHRKVMAENEKRKRRSKQLLPLDPFPPSKYPFPDIVSAYLIASLTGVDPTDLWPRWRRYSPFFKLQICTGLEGRGVPLTTHSVKDMRKMVNTVWPYLENGKVPEDPIVAGLLRVMGWSIQAHDRFKARFGFEFSGPHGKTEARPAA